VVFPLYVLEEIQRYLTDYAWEWRTISKVINYKYGYTLEPESMERVYKKSMRYISGEIPKRKEGELRKPLSICGSR